MFLLIKLGRSFGMRIAKVASELIPFGIVDIGQLRQISVCCVCLMLIEWPIRLYKSSRMIHTIT